MTHAAGTILTSPRKPNVKDAANARRTFALQVKISIANGAHAPELLARESGLSKLRIKDAMQKGAVWLTRGTRKPLRLRRATAELCAGDVLDFYYDSAVIDRVPPVATLVAEQKRYSVWFKPAGLLVEGSRYGDHATLAHQVAAHYGGRREVFLVHRLDMEAAGVMIIAHSSGATAKLSALFRERLVIKEYLVDVLGDLGAVGTIGNIELALEGKAARTDYVVEAVNTERGHSRLRVRMATGRYHQIRQHFAAVGTPVLGDPRYGSGNADPRGLQLQAIMIEFVDPWSSGEAVHYSIPARWAPL